MLKDDESIKDCRYLLRHPLAIEDDMRLVSTVELMAIREEVQNALPTEGPVLDSHYDVLRDADLKFKNWYATWDQAFSQKYTDASRWYLSVGQGRCILIKRFSSASFLSTKSPSSALAC